VTSDANAQTVTVSVERLARPHIRALEPYEPGKPADELERELGIEGAVKLASNENPLGPSPAAVEALRGALAGIHRYPDGHAFALRAKLCARLGVAPEQLVLGNGSDEVLELLAKTFLGPEDEVVYAWPSFAMYPIVVRGMGAVSTALWGMSNGKLPWGPEHHAAYEHIWDRTAGMVIGHTQRPLVNRGDAIVHVAELDLRGPLTLPQRRVSFQR